MDRKLAPKARKSKLIVKVLADEVLVYDENNHKAHCLNQTAALVWKFCDGRTSIPRMMRLLEKEMSASVPEQTVWLAIKQLEASRLLDEQAIQQAWMPQTSRRAVMRTIGIAAVALPLITSVRAAAAVAAASCVPLGQPCVGAGLGNCCPGASVACAGSPNGTCHVT
jgi:hypothetical protein